MLFVFRQHVNKNQFLVAPSWQFFFVAVHSLSSTEATVFLLDVCLPFHGDLVYMYICCVNAHTDSHTVAKATARLALFTEGTRVMTSLQSYPRCSSGSWLRADAALKHHILSASAKVLLDLPLCLQSCCSGSLLALQYLILLKKSSGYFRHLPVLGFFVLLSEKKSTKTSAV